MISTIGSLPVASWWSRDLRAATWDHAIGPVASALGPAGPGAVRAARRPHRNPRTGSGGLRGVAEACGNLGRCTKAAGAPILAAFLANLGIAIAKFVGFLITGSAGLLAEAVHSLADTGNQLLLLLGGKRAAKAADTAHPFGYGRERYFWAFVVALVLFSMGGLFALYEGIDKLRHPHEVESLGVAIGILLFAMVLEGFSLRTAYKEASAHRTDDGRVAALDPPLEAARAARGPARGHRRR